MHSSSVVAGSCRCLLLNFPKDRALLQSSRRMKSERLARNSQGARRGGPAQPANMLNSKRPRRETRQPFSAWQGHVKKDEKPAGSSATGAASSSSQAAPAMGAEGPVDAFPKWQRDQMNDLKRNIKTRAEKPAADATPAELASAAFRENTFRARPAHHPERFINYIKGRPVVVAGEKNMGAECPTFMFLLNANTFYYLSQCL